MARFGLLRFAGLLLCVPLLAQDSTQAPTATSPATAAPQRRHAQVDRAEQRLRHLSKRLNLTDDQKQKLLPILQDEASQMKSVDDDTSLTPQQRHRKLRDIRASSRSQMDGILTDDQKQKLQTERPQHTGAHHGRRAVQGQGTTTPDQTNPQ